MKKIFTSNSKIKCTLLSTLFSILFIFTALYFKEPLVTYAAPSGPDASSSIGQVMNLNSYSANETDESSNETAGYLYWAASGDRNYGHIHTIFILKNTYALQM